MGGDAAQSQEPLHGNHGHRLARTSEVTRSTKAEAFGPFQVPRSAAVRF